MLETFFIYNTSLFFSVFFAWVANNCKAVLVRNIFVILSFSILFFLAAIRDNVGADFENYIEIYNTIEQFGIDKLEPIFYSINFLLRLFDIHYQYLFVIIAFISLFFVFKTGLRIKHLDLVVLLYVIIFYLNSLNALRQETAVTILMYSIICLINRENKKFILFVFLASGFHYVSLLFLPLVILIRFNYNFIILTFTLVSSFILLKFNFVEILLNTGILVGTKYQVYLFMDIYNKGTEVGSGLGMISRYFIVFPLLFLSKAYYYKQDILLRNISLYLCSLLLVSVSISMNFYVFHRLVSLFSIGLLFAVITIYRSRLNKAIKFGIISISILLSLTFFELDIQLSQKSLGENKAISPYTTIFRE